MSSAHFFFLSIHECDTTTIGGYDMGAEPYNTNTYNIYFQIFLFPLFIVPPADGIFKPHTIYIICIWLDDVPTSILSRAPACLWINNGLLLLFPLDDLREQRNE